MVSTEKPNQKKITPVQLFNICEGSCDTENCSNDAENSALHHRNTLHFKIYSNIKQLFEIVKTFHNITVSLYINQINAALVSIRDVFQRRNTYWACLTCSHTCKMPCFLEILMTKLKSELKLWQYVKFSLILCCQTSIFFFVNIHAWILPNPRERQQWNVSVTIYVQYNMKKKLTLDLPRLLWFLPALEPVSTRAAWLQQVGSLSEQQTNKQTRYWTTSLLIKKSNHAQSKAIKPIFLSIDRYHRSWSN